MLQFHGAICEILHIPPVISLERLAILDECEELCGIAFPAAVREWFAIPDVELYFSKHSHPDYLVPVGKLGQGQHKQIAQGWLLVATENQGVVLWFCRLNGTDDPPVWDDDNEYHHVPFAQISWRQNSLHFSGFIFGFLADSHYKSWRKGLHIDTTSPSFPDSTLEILQSHFRLGPFVEQGPQREHRFYNEGAFIHVSRRGATDEMKWTIRAVSQDALREILTLLKPKRAWLEKWQVTGSWRGPDGYAGQRVLDEYEASGELED